MSAPLYPPARAFAARLADHFARHAAAEPPGSLARAPLPDAGAIEALIDVETVLF